MVQLKSNEHAFFAGKTRSGKTVLVQSLCNQFPRIVIHDRKWEWGNFARRNHYMRVDTPETLLSVLKRGGKRVLYQPADPSTEDFDEVCKILFYTANITFVVDEAASYNAHNMTPFWMGELLRLGSGKGIGVISLVQRPRDVANVLLSESTIIVSFKLQLDTDRTKIAGTCGPEVKEPLRTLPKYAFMLFDADNEQVYWCAPIPYTP